MAKSLVTISPDRMQRIMQDYKIEEPEDLYTEILWDASLEEKIFQRKNLLLFANTAEAQKNKEHQMSPQNFTLVNWYLHHHTQAMPILDYHKGLPGTLKMDHVRTIGKALLQTDIADQQKVEGHFKALHKETGLKISKKFWYYTPDYAEDYPRSERNQALLQRFANFCLLAESVQIRTDRVEDDEEDDLY